MSWWRHAQAEVATRLGLAHRLPVWTHEAYRLPIADVHSALGIEPRRADLTLWGLLGAGNAAWLEVHESPRVTYADLARVHDATYLEALTRPEDLARIFGLPKLDVPADPVLATFRFATGGTIAATRHVLAHGGPALNLLGGFHHAHHDRGGGLCPMNDIAVALAVAREEGFDGQVVVLDLDAHPPDGLADTLHDDPACFIGSISGSDWGPLEGVDETVVPGADDATYLAALRALLSRAPRPDLVFVLAGGDVLSDDRMGALGLTLEGARERDATVLAWVDDAPSVWVPAGGYQTSAWRVLAGTATVLIGRQAAPVPPDLDPVAAHFAYVSRSLDPVDLHGRDDGWFTQEEVDAMFGSSAKRQDDRLLGYYTREGLEYVLYAYGFLTHLRRLGYGHFDLQIEHTPTGDRVVLTGEADGERHLLWEMIVAKESFEGHDLLYLHWMQMRHPRGRFAPGHPKLPGQDAPGLGMAEEAMQLLFRAAERLSLEGLLLRPAWYHTAWMGRSRFHFATAEDEGAFEALQRDLADVPIPVISQAFVDGRVQDHGKPWPWPAAPMVAMTDPTALALDPDAVAAAAARHAFTLVPA